MDNLLDVIKDTFYKIWDKYVLDENCIIQKYYAKFFKREKSTYGYQASIKSYIIFYLIGLAVIFFVAWLSQLNWKFILTIMVIATLMFPIIVVAIINQKNEQKRFEMVTSYLTNIIPIFVQNPKILWALKEVEVLLEHRIKEIVHDAVVYLETNVDDPDAEATALRLIEIEFPNTRVAAVNKLMLSIEKDNSLDYKETCMAMYDDIDAWINRVYDYQKELTKRRTQLALLCILTVAMNVMFITMYQSNDFFVGFGQSLAYQVVTTLFLLSILIVITMCLTKLHGKWIVNDNTVKSNQKVEKAYDILNGNVPSIRTPDIIVGAVAAVLAIVVIIIFNQKFIGVVILGLAIFIITYKYNQKSRLQKTVKKAFEIEFPLWLRTVSLNLYSMTVLRAINRSKEVTTYAFTKELNKFTEEAELEPTNIKPYITFLSKWGVLTAGASMRVLYSIQNLGTADVKAQASALIVRNQKLLLKSEELRNKENLSSIELLGYVPMILFSIQMLVSMLLLILTVLAKMSVDLNW